MRYAFHKELERLDQEIVRMGALVEQSAQLVTRALIEGDRTLAQRIRSDDDVIDAMYLDIEKRSLALLAQQAPVAGDLRLIVAILRADNDLERSADLTSNIAKLALIEDFREPVIKSVRSHVADLGEAAARLLGIAIDAWAAKDQKLAEDIAVQDDRLDELHARMIEELVELKGEEALGPAIRLAMVARYFERIGDHAVNIGESIRYFITGDEEYLG